MCDTKILITTPYHPQCDGLVERLNGTLATSLTAYGKAKQDNWNEFLPSFLMAYCTSTTSAHGITPFHLLYGRKVRVLMDIGLIPPSKVPTSHTKYRCLIAQNIVSRSRIALNIDRSLTLSGIMEFYSTMAI